MQLSSEHEIHHNLKNSEIDNQVGVGGGDKNENADDNILQGGTGTQNNIQYIDPINIDYVKREASDTFKSEKVIFDSRYNNLDNLDKKWFSAPLIFIETVRNSNFNFIIKVFFLIFIYFLLSYIIDKILFFYNLNAEVGYIYYTWIILLIILFFVLPTKGGYFDYLN
tara:strand:- start:3852 stop:4352 length:501 start_codon:yes stop_codon:yes gene_type:complete